MIGRKLSMGLLVLSFAGPLCAKASSATTIEKAVEHSVPEIKLDVEKYSLGNGLTVLLYEDHSAPLVSVQQWFRVGGKHEIPGQSGLAHFFEHLMFKRTKNQQAGDYDRIVQENGGSNNAFTSNDFTGYYVNLPSDKLEPILQLESDRMVNLLLEQKTIDSERGVVKDERRMRYEDRPSGALWHATMTTVFRVHQYKNPVIGSMRDLNAATLKDFELFYKTYYSPNNAVLVIAGDINKSVVKDLIKKYYEPIPSQKIPEYKPLIEPPQNGHRSAVLVKDVQAPMFMTAFRAPKEMSDEAAAMTVLATILGTGDSSRLHQRLVYRQQLATSTWAYHSENVDDGVFMVNVSLKPTQDLDKAVASVYSELYKLRTNPVKDEELQKAKNILMADKVNSLKTISGKARYLASAEITTGDYRNLLGSLEKYSKVTADDILKVAQKYLTPEKRSLVKVVPRKQGE